MTYWDAQHHYARGLRLSLGLPIMTRPKAQLLALGQPRKLKRGDGMHDYVEQRDGGYCIAGTRIAVDSIIVAFKDGQSPETILQSFPMAGPLVRVYGAITFYLEHTEEVEAYLADQERLWAEVKAKQTELPESLAARLREAKDHSAPRSA
jgi:uncharacterized protein (DUF433 family)